ncbi:N-6 DNA methylase, partial [Burkholderia ambifaria]|uniref:N-6 DNA methylase n=1 Tax=Burkholderia ambifaria TaxID=152480 RepID=UPI0012FE3ED2
MQTAFDFEASDWYAPLRAMKSLGSLDVGVAHHGELAAARRRHLGQFFTPDAVARYMWGFVERFNPKRKVHVLDNSIGSGRLLQFGDPERHSIYGVDVHDPAVTACQSVFEGAGFKVSIRRAGMEEIQPSGFDVAMINPPFSLHLESPHLYPFECTTIGRYGPNTSALSHDYALAQALKAANVVVALLPATMAEAIAGATLGKPFHYYGAAKRLAGYFELPDDAFQLEGANVRTAVLVFDRYRTRQGDFVRAAADLGRPAPL